MGSQARYILEEGLPIGKISDIWWYLKKGESFQTPEMVLVHSVNGMNGMSQTLHTLYRTRLARGVWRDRVRPILINNWEATYFDFNEEKILKIAGTAKQLGIELFVLDDGWFGKRNLDNCSLGDWYPNYEKLPDGITGLAKKIEALGLSFGLWFEPEMTNKDSDLFRAHPDWLLADLRRNYCHSRNQYVLDFSKPEVVDYVHAQMQKILREAPVSYVKWDMNRSFSEVFSNGRGKEVQGQVRHRYILGVYELYERLHREFPEILFESCASGGARFDPGMLYYAPLDTRANVAYFGTFGYELDITKLPEEELEKMKVQIAFMKAHRELIQKGRFYRLKSPFEGNSSAWQVVSEDGTEALLAYFRILQPAQGGFERIYLKGLEELQEYAVQECFGAEIDCGVHYGDELMYAGFSVSDVSSGVPGVARKQQGDYFSRLFYLKREDFHR